MRLWLAMGLLMISGIARAEPVTLREGGPARVPAPGARPRTENVLDTVAVDWALCMYCGICVEVCPFDALAWHAESIAATAEPDGLRHGIDQLAGPS